MKINTWWKKYRVVTDHWLGYEVQVKYIWWPFWSCLMKPKSTYESMEKATKGAIAHSKRSYILEDINDASL